MAWSAGISRMHGPHQEAKKLRTTGLPRRPSSATGGRPDRTSSSVNGLASPVSLSVPGTLPRLSSVVTATPTAAPTRTTPATSHQPQRRRRGAGISGSIRSRLSRSDRRGIVSILPQGTGRRGRAGGTAAPGSGGPPEDLGGAPGAVQGTAQGLDRDLAGLVGRAVAAGF